MAAAPLYNPDAPIYDGTGTSGPIAASPGAPAAKPLTGQRVNVAKDGETISIDLSELAAAEARGFKPETSEARGIRQYVEENKGIGGTAKVALRGLLDEATFGVGDVAIDAMRDPYELARWEALKSDHSVANITGRVAGFGASLLYGGEFFGVASKAGGTAARLLGRGAVEGVEHAAGRAVAAELAYRTPAIGAEATKVGSGVARKILQSAGDYGAQGLVLSSPKAMAQLIAGDPDRAAETWVYGAAGGAALGGLVGGVSGIAGKMLNRGVDPVATEALAGVGAAETGKAGKFANKVAEEHAFRSLASNHASLKKAAKDALTIEGGQRGIGRELLDSGLVRGVREDVSAYAERLAAAKSEAGEVVGGMYKRLDELGADTGLSVKELVKKMRDDVLHPLQGKPGFEGVASKVEAYVNSFEEKAASGGWSFGSKDKITFERLHDVRAGLDDLVWRSGGLNPAEHIKELREIRRMVQRDLVEKGEAFAQSHGQEFAGPLKAANLKYQRLNAAEKAAADYAETRALTNRNISPTDYLTGAAAGIIGGGIGGAAMGAVASFGHKLLREEGNALLARGLDALGKGRGLVALEQSFASHADKLNRIPQALEAMGAGKAARSAVRDTMEINVLTRFLGAHDANLDDQKGLLAFADNLASLASDPQRRQQRITEHVEAVRGDAPDVAMLAGAKLTQVATYLHEKAPKPPTVRTPFEPKGQWKPTDTQIKDFKSRVKTALDPYHAIDALNAGTLTRAHVETLQTLAPRLYEEMVKRVMEFGASGKAKPLPYAQRLKLSMLTGAPLDRSIAQVASYQTSFASADAQPEKRTAKLNAPELGTEIQRLTATT